ncbi:MAG: hypothetical protein ACI97A_002513 [Planctomycetota bacterium]|jgi:hypothetical protein
MGGNKVNGRMILSAVFIRKYALPEGYNQDDCRRANTQGSYETLQKSFVIDSESSTMSLPDPLHTADSSVLITLSRLMRNIIILLLALVPLIASGQEVTYFSVKEKVMGGTSMQLYFDFLPNSLVLGVPPLTPPEEDALIIITPLPEDITANGFAGLLANKLSDYFKKNGSTNTASHRDKGSKGETAHDATIRVITVTAIDAIYASGDFLTAPSAEVMSTPGISFNPSIANATQRLTRAFQGTPNAQLLINDINPNDDPTHQVEVFTPGNLKFSFQSGTNQFQPVTFMLSEHYHPENIPAAFVSFPGSLDLGTFSAGNFQNITVVADANFGGTGSLLDAFFFTNSLGILDFQVSVPLTAAGKSLATQAVIADPTVMPVGLSFTQAADIQFSVGAEQTLILGDNGNAPVSFIQGTSFDFYGTTYTSVTVSANGYVSFGGALGTPNDAIVSPAAALAQNPAIFANWADWDTSGTGVQVRQFGAEFRINWGTTLSPISHSGLSDSGAFSLVLHLDIPPNVAPPSQSEAEDLSSSVASAAGSIFVDTAVLDNGNMVETFDSLVGISPGSIMTPGMVPNLFFDDPLSPPVANQPLLSHANAAGMALSTLNTATGGPALYDNGQSLEGRSLSFLPITGLGQTRYNSVPDSIPDSDLQGADISAINIQTNLSNPVNFNLVGYLRHLFSFNPTQPLPTLGLVEAATLAPIATINFVSLMTPNGGADAGGTVAAPLTIPTAAGFNSYQGALVRLPAGSLVGIAPGLLARIRIILPNGNMILSRDVITLM